MANPSYYTITWKRGVSRPMSPLSRLLQPPNQEATIFIKKKKKIEGKKGKKRFRCENGR
jgi:hypothetical protein